ncbi:tetratricopeptide repeat protein [Aestuariibaculum lutulentum]|uniref:Tetratricopeptide repeat protein n=1 Tax=Aestuariibaculum lutulentum TaxID=2920935 RepID=A0ABS9RF27_9FLAO|nr:tetratricopeptide repeat protein [Aestuariibaculum lutulentum]MCH4551545.1 tetratricopeptide repeat protein [Aestuariibaculum lutulentum]
MPRILFLLFFPILTIAQVDSKKIQDLLVQEKFFEAEEVLNTYLKQHPNDMEAVELLGDTYGHQKKWDEAMNSYQTLIEFDGKNANYHYKFGGVLGMKALSVSKIRALTLIDDLEEAFLKAAKLDPKHIDARWALVEYYMKLPGFLGGGVSSALPYAEELEKLSKVDGYLAKGFIYENDNEPELAEKYYKLAITEGGSLVCYDKLTKFYIAQDEPEKAILNLKAAYERHQDADLLIQIKALEKP